MTAEHSHSLLWLPKTTVDALLKLYDYCRPNDPGKIIEGYDKFHALRTAKMCAAVAQRLGYDHDRIKQYQASCLLHDLGRVGLDPPLFGKIWSWAKQQQIPTRPAEWRAVHPDTIYGQETEAFLERYRSDLEKLGISIDAWTVEQVEMRLGYSRRLRQITERLRPQLEAQGIQWCEWMEQVVSYYYYPEKLNAAPDWVRELGEVLVACEQLEAYSNRERGAVYYNRTQESFSEAFNYLEKLTEKGQLGEKVLTTVKSLTAEGVFDDILASACNRTLSTADLAYLRSLKPH